MYYYAQNIFIFKLRTDFFKNIILFPEISIKFFNFAGFIYYIKEKYS